MAGELEQRVLAAWKKTFCRFAASLMRDGVEDVVLVPVARHPRMAHAFVVEACSSATYTDRKVGAALAGHLSHFKAATLSMLVDRERDRTRAGNEMDALYAQSVVEDVVFAAVRWSTRPAQRDDALRFLGEMVERTAAGEYWNTAAYAMTTLVARNAPDADWLLEMFTKWAAGPPPAHASRPSLKTERDFAAGLAARNPKTLGAIDAVLRDKDAACARFRLHPGDHRNLDAWLRDVAAAEASQS